MRFLILTILLISSGISLHAQQVSAEPNFTISSQPESLEINSDQSENPLLEQDYEKFTCQRCGSENLIPLGDAHALKGSSLTIPHCSYCGKKYWPKFTPGSIIQRTYCSSVVKREHI